MLLSEFKNALSQIDELLFSLEDGTPVPAHVHLTEMGELSKNYVDCGGTVRADKFVNFQLWFDTDTHHRLSPSKVLAIIAQSEQLLALGDWPIEVEYQAQTIGKFALSFNGVEFVLINKQTACLAEDKCGITPSKTKIKLSEFTLLNNESCTPGSGCC
jgi:hypothetical protein